MAKKEKRKILSPETKQWILGIVIILFSLIVILSFFEKAGIAGKWFMIGSQFLIGKTIFLLPLFLFLAGMVFLKSKINKEHPIFVSVLIGFLLLLIGFSGILGSINFEQKNGGYLGYTVNWPFLKYFGDWATRIIFLTILIIGFLIFKPFLQFNKPLKEEESVFSEDPEKLKKSVIRKIFKPKFRQKEIDSGVEERKKQTEEKIKLEEKPINGKKLFSYEPPPLDLLEAEKGVPSSGDIKVNSSIIKKTLQDFNIEVIMSEVNIGPTVTQYTFKPSEGVKLSKITGLANDLALALASHPIRIEAPIPGRSLVGIEIPNQVRAQVRLRNLLETPNFQKLPFSLTIALGKDVSGFPIYVDLTKMPHMLVAGATGSGKTIFLNNLILNLLYQPTNSFKSASPQSLRFILVDPKRVEFPVYQNLPHLLCPVIYSPVQTINALKWLVKEMERRFDVLAEAKSRNINSFNEQSFKKGKDPLPFIVVIIDELADLMAARGKDIEALIVRLAQMARAVGIHLVVATQRPSVEVITGLIKANITSRVAFKVASQVDSRTIIDTSGAEKLLGSGDMLYISSEHIKPKRIQAAYLAEKEIRRVLDYITTENKNIDHNGLQAELLEALEKPAQENIDYAYNNDDEEDPLYEEAKTVVVEAKKASASLLQRRLKIGYARAARLLDLMEERGIVGPADGAKAREIYINNDQEDESWEKV
ncbi:MAG: DNA translocase FtsK [Candidatus Pacebacteria bacterium]|nr:DNA translocase FtsK [Candidatus Paceibacterota bacterium]